MNVANILAPPIVAWALAKSLWLPFGIASVMHIAMMLIICIMAESHSLSSRSRHQLLPVQDATEPLLQSTQGPSSSQTHNPNQEFDMRSSSSLAQPTAWTNMKELLCRRGIPILMVCTFLKRIGFLTEGFFPQYATQAFRLHLGRTAWFYEAQSLGAILGQLVGLPMITNFLSHGPRSQRSTDIIILRIGLSILVLSYLGTWAATEVVVFGLGMTPSS